MGIFEDDYGGDKQCVYGWMVEQESVETLKAFLMFEDVCVNGFVNAFPGKVAFKWASVLEKEERENKKKGQ